MNRARQKVLEGISAAAPLVGPANVHLDITNTCNAACVTCWDHSPHLETARPQAWKRRRLAYSDFGRLIEQLDALGSVEAIVISGMGDPLMHPDVYQMIADVKARGWHLTLLTNLIAADIEQLSRAGVDQLLVGVHGATPASYAAFHPGWNETHFFTMCRYLRALARTDTRCRHVQVINRDNHHELEEMVRFGGMFKADRVNFKLASLYDGTEAVSVDREQIESMIVDGLPRARGAADRFGVRTNLDLFEAQLHAAFGRPRATTPIEAIGCFMGYVYTRITVDREVLFCCNTAVKVGSLEDATMSELWFGHAWQSLRSRLRDGHYFSGCDKCGKFEQNVKWSARFRAHAGEAAWRDAIGADRAPQRLRVIS